MTSTLAPNETGAHTEEAPKEERKHGNMPLDMVTTSVFFQLDPSFRHLPKAERDQAKQSFIAAVEPFRETVWVRSYSTFGLREDADFFLWNIGKELEPIHEMLTAIYRSDMGPYLKQTYNYVSISKESDYTKDHKHPPPANLPDDPKYLFIYPFVKTREWYLLPFPERMRIMKEHIDVGHKFDTISINTSYSFGIDDQDFVVAFDGNSLQEFVKLVMALRETESSRYTVQDTPMFIGMKKTLADTLDSLGI